MPLSQSSTVLMGIEKYSEKALWVMPDALRRALMRMSVSILNIQRKGTEDAFDLVVAVIGIVFIDAPAALNVVGPEFAIIDSQAIIGIVDEVEVSLVFDDVSFDRSAVGGGFTSGFQNFKISHGVNLLLLYLFGSCAPCVSTSYHTLRGLSRG